MHLDRRRFLRLSAAAAKLPAIPACRKTRDRTSPLELELSDFEDCEAVEVRDSHLQNMAMADRLWLLSEQMTKDYLVRHETPGQSEFENSLRRPGGDAS